MDRRTFLGQTLAAGALAALAPSLAGSQPTLPTITVYNTGDSQTGSFRNATDSTNLTAVAGTATDHGVVIGSAAATANKEYQFHLTADAEIA